MLKLFLLRFDGYFLICCESIELSLLEGEKLAECNTDDINIVLYSCVRLYILAPIPPASITFFENEAINGTGSYQLWFNIPKTCLFSQVLVSITDTDDGNSTEFTYQHNGNNYATSNNLYRICDLIYSISVVGYY